MTGCANMKEGKCTAVCLWDRAVMFQRDVCVARGGRKTWTTVIKIKLDSQVMGDLGEGTSGQEEGSEETQSSR